MEIITLGSDPEFVCQDLSTKEFKAMCGLLGGTKKVPLQIEGAPEGCCKQEDNVGAELTVPPCKTIEEIMYHINISKTQINKYLKNINPNWELQAVSSARFDPSQLCSDQAMEFGCEPSFSIYTGTSERPEPESVGNLRSFGFHIHFGMKDFTNSDIADFVFACDLFLGLPALLLDKDQDRRKIYGNLGDFRLPKYGLEYRVMGAGMMEHWKHVEKGIDKIKIAIANREKLAKARETLFEDFLALDKRIKGLLNPLHINSLIEEGEKLCI